MCLFQSVLYIIWLPLVSYIILINKDYFFNTTLPMLINIYWIIIYNTKYNDLVYIRYINLHLLLFKIVYLVYLFIYLIYLILNYYNENNNNKIKNYKISFV